jgi:hypothetical protein
MFANNRLGAQWLDRRASNTDHAAVGEESPEARGRCTITAMVIG